MRRKTLKMKEMTNDIYIFNIIDKKNNQTSVSDSDREIPTLGSALSGHEISTFNYFFIANSNAKLNRKQNGLLYKLSYC